MSNFIETSLDNLADASKKIMEKCISTGDLTKADVLFLSMYQKEKSQALQVPTYKKVIGAVTEVFGLIKGLLPKQTDESSFSNTEDIALDMEVDTDEL